MNFDFTLKTSLGVDEVVDTLEKTLKEDGFGILWDSDLTNKLQEKCMDFNTPYRFLRFANRRKLNVY